MSAVESLRNVIKERLTAAAEEILGAFVTTISVYEEEISRQRRLLDVFVKPETHQSTTGADPGLSFSPSEVPHQQHVYQEEEVLADQQHNSQPSISSLEKEDPDLQQIKVEQEELCTSMEEERLVHEEDDLLISNVLCERSDRNEVWALVLNCDQNQSEAEKNPRDNSSTNSIEADPDSEHSEVCVPSSDHQLLFHTPSLQVETYHGYKHVNHCNTTPERKPTAAPTSTRNIHSKYKDNQDQQQETCSSENTALSINSQPELQDKPFKCSICSKDFNLDTQLRVHMRTHTTEKPFSCTVCGKRFSVKRYLAQHMITHTAERPYNCNRCWKTFRRLQTLQFHMRSHTGEKPYTCVICGREFPYQTSLTNHVRIHTGEKPYQCTLCGERFSISTKLKLHTQVHKGEMQSISDTREDFFSQHRTDITREAS